MAGEDPLPAAVTAAVDDLKAATGFLTRLPARWIGADPQSRPDFRRGARVFPVIGALIGVVGGAIIVIGAWAGVPPLVVGALAVTATMALTGGMHEDGLADTADGFGGSTAEQRLQIMDDSRIGTFGAAALILTLILRVASLATIAAISGAVTAAVVLVAAECVSRAAMVRVWQDLPAARTGGLSEDAGAPDQQAMLIALAVGIVFAALTVPFIGWRAALIATVLSAIATYLFTRLTAMSIGGRTGDTLGACQQIAMVAFLVGAATG